MVNAPARGQAGAARCCHRATCFGLVVGLCRGLNQSAWRINCRKAGLELLRKTSPYPTRHAKTLCPVATPGCACLPPPAGALTISTC